MWEPHAHTFETTHTQRIYKQHIYDMKFSHSFFTHKHIAFSMAKRRSESAENTNKISLLSAKLVIKLLGFQDDDDALASELRPLFRGIYCTGGKDAAVTSDVIDLIVEGICECFGAPELKTDQCVIQWVSEIIAMQKIGNPKFVGMPQRGKNTVGRGYTFVVVQERAKINGFSVNTQLILTDTNDVQIKDEQMDQVSAVITRMFNMQLLQRKCITWVEFFRLFDFPTWRENMIHMTTCEVCKNDGVCPYFNARKINAVTLKRQGRRANFVKDHVQWMESNLVKCDDDQYANEEVLVTSSQEKQREDGWDQEAQEADQGRENPYNQNHSPSNTVVEQDDTVVEQDVAGSKRYLDGEEYSDIPFSPLKKLQHLPPMEGVSPSNIWKR